jgi:hypothetical protein
MAAVGMLAPWVESIFNQAFQGIREQFFARDNSPGTHPRWQWSTEDRVGLSLLLGQGEGRQDRPSLPELSSWRKRRDRFRIFLTI